MFEILENIAFYEASTNLNKFNQKSKQTDPDNNKQNKSSFSQYIFGKKKLDDQPKVTKKA